MKVLIPKRGKMIEAEGAAGVLEVLNESSLLPAETLEGYKAELRVRLSSWLGEKVETNEDEKLVDELVRANALIMVER
jgi:hypothetical protein